MDERVKNKPSIKGILGVLLPLVIDYVVQIVIITGFTFVIIYYNRDLANDKDGLTDAFMKHAITITLIVDAVLIPIMIGLMMYDKNKIKKTKGLVRRLEKFNYFKYLILIPFAFASLMLFNIVTSLAMKVLPEAFTRSYDEAAASIYGGNVYVMVFAVCIVGPVLEELMFRGVVYNRIKIMSNEVVAIILSAVIFGAFHMNWVQGIYAGMLGLCLAYVYSKYKSVIAPIIVHVVCNSISIMATLVKDGGLEEAASNSAEEAITTDALISAMGVYAVIFVIMVLIIESKVKRKEEYVAVYNMSDRNSNFNMPNNMYNGYNNMNNGYNNNNMNNGYNNMNNGYNNTNNGYNNTNNNYNTNNGNNNTNNGYNDGFGVYTKEDYERIDDYLSGKYDSNQK